MSIATWKKKFYPINANNILLNTDAKMLKHSIKKWEGLLAKNLRQHTMSHSAGSGEIHQTDSFAVFPITGGTCALCCEYYNGIFNECTQCPIFKYLKTRICSKEFNRWRNHNDPNPMLNLLKTVYKNNVS